MCAFGYARLIFVYFSDEKSHLVNRQESLLNNLQKSHRESLLVSLLNNRPWSHLGSHREKLLSCLSQINSTSVRGAAAHRNIPFGLLTCSAKALLFRLDQSGTGRVILGVGISCCHPRLEHHGLRFCERATVTQRGAHCRCERG
jgi:hypothetical protein